MKPHAVAIGVAISALIPFHASAQTVVIEGTRESDYRKAESSLSKLTESIRDTPQSATIVARQEIEDRGFSALNDALRTVPGISLGAGETSWQGTNLFLRGFTTRNDMFMDGMRDYGYYYRDPFNNESIEVLKGPASILFGRGSTGGVIQQQSKAVTLSPLTAASLAFGSDNSGRGTLDIGGRLSALGDTAGYRLNAMVHEGEVADRDGARHDRWGVAPSLAMGLGTPTRLQLSYLHQSDDIRPDYGLPWFAGKPADVRRSNYYGFDDDYLNTRVDILTARIEHDFGSAVTVRNQTRHSRAEREFRISEAAIPAGTPVNTHLEAINVGRNEFEGYSTDSFTQNQTDLVARFKAGGLEHTVVTGFEVGRESPEPVYITNVGVPTTNLAHPDPEQVYSVLQSYPRLAARTRADSLGLYALDTIKFSEQWHVMLGARWDRFDSEYHSTGYSAAGQVIATTSLDQTDQAPSYRAALVYKPKTAGTLYLSYGTSFNPSAEGIESLVSSGRAVAQANLALDPEESRTYELGAKWEFRDAALLLSTAVFRIEKTNARVPDPTVPGFNTLGGEQRVDGFEAELVGSLSSAWKMRAGYSYFDSETTRSTPGGPRVGAPLTITPEHTLSLWSDHRLMPGLKASIGVLHVSSRLGQNTTASYLEAPGYTTVDVMAKYRITPKLIVQVNVNNLTNAHYFDQLHPFHVVPGPGRTALLSLRLRY